MQIGKATSTSKQLCLACKVEQNRKKEREYQQVRQAKGHREPNGWLETNLLEIKVYAKINIANIGQVEISSTLTSSFPGMFVCVCV